MAKTRSQCTKVKYWIRIMDEYTNLDLFGIFSSFFYYAHLYSDAILQIHLHFYMGRQVWAPPTLSNITATKQTLIHKHDPAGCSEYPGVQTVMFFNQPKTDYHKTSCKTGFSVTSLCFD